MNEISLPVKIVLFIWGAGILLLTLVVPISVVQMYGGEPVVINEMYFYGWSFLDFEPDGRELFRINYKLVMLNLMGWSAFSLGLAILFWGSKKEVEF